MRKKVYIKEDILKNKLSNFLYGSNVEKNLYEVLNLLGLKEDKYILNNYNSDDSSFDCIGTHDTYKIRLGLEYANEWNYPTIEINNHGVGINYFYCLNENLKQTLKVRDYSKEVNGKIYTRVLNYSPDYENKKENFYMRNIKQGNEEAFFYIIDPKIDYDELDKKIINKDFSLDWVSIYNLLESYGDIEKYIVFRKENDHVEDLASFGFPLEEIYNYYRDDRAEENIKVRIKSR